MSIDSLRKVSEKPGCRYLILTVSGLLGISFIMSGSCRNAAAPAPNATQTDPGTLPIVTVGDVNITRTQVDQAVQSMRERQASQGGADMAGPVPTNQEAFFEGGALDQLIRGAYWSVLAAKKGIKMTDDQMVASVQAALDEEISQMRTQAIASGQMKGTSDKDFDAFLMKTRGETRAQLEGGALDHIKTQLADPDQRPQIVYQVLQQAISKLESADVHPTIDQVKASFTTFTTKRIFVRPVGDPASALATIQKALAEVKAGTPFETAMNRYSTDPVQPGKTVSSLTTPVQGNELAVEPDLAPIATLKPGQVSGIIPVDGGFAIYKLVGSTTNLPKDFATNQAMYLKNYTDTVAQSKMEKEYMDVSKDTSQIKWDSKGWQLLDELIKDLQGTGLPGAGVDYNQVATEAKADTGDQMGGNAAAMARYLALTNLWSTADAKAKDSMRADYIDSITSLLQTTEGVDLRLQLVDLFLQEKNGPMAANALVDAANRNTDVGTYGQSYYSQIFAREATLKAKGYLTASDEASINSAQAEWKKNRTQKDAYDAEQAKLQAQEKAAALAEQNKAQTPTPPSPPLKPVARDQVKPAAPSGQASKK